MSREDHLTVETVESGSCSSCRSCRAQEEADKRGSRGKGPSEIIDGFWRRRRARGAGDRVSARRGSEVGSLGPGGAGRAGSAVRASLRAYDGATLNRARVGAAGGAQTVFIGDHLVGFITKNIQLRYVLHHPY
eukprot:2768441-Prymnesium_polylepis.1